MKRSPLACLAAAILIPASVRADNWIVGEVPAAVAVGGPQEQLFRPGLLPAVGAYAEQGRVAIGLRLRFGALANGPAPASVGTKDPGMGGLATAGLAFRVRDGQGWAEAVIGGGVTGTDLVSSVELGVGWTFHAGTVDVGPSVRWVRVNAPSQAGSLGAANLALAGIDVRFGHDRPVRPRFVWAAPPPPPPPFVPPPPAYDGDRIADADASCAQDDDDGCEVTGDIVLHDDRFVLDDRVLFDVARAHVHAAGREVVAAIAVAMRQHPEWKHVTIEGHCDVRGSDDYNQGLSERRAEAVRAVLVRSGIPAERVDAVGYGRSRPIDLGEDEAAHRRNRRVEFVIDREGTIGEVRS